MRTIKLPMPPLQSLGITENQEHIAAACVLAISNEIKRIGDTRLQYKNVQLIDDCIYVDINTTRLPALAWYLSKSVAAAYQNDLLTAINSHPLENAIMRRPATWEQIESYDLRLWPADWLGFFLWSACKASFSERMAAYEDTAPPYLDNDVFIKELIEQGCADIEQETLSEKQAGEIDIYMTEYGNDPYLMKEIIKPFTNEVIRIQNDIDALGLTGKSASDYLESSTAKLRATYQDKAMQLDAQMLWDIRHDDNYIKADDFFM